jgi:hypothetical protein
MLETPITILVCAVIILAAFVWLAHRDVGRAIGEMQAGRASLDRSAAACERAADAVNRAADAANRAAEACISLAQSVREMVAHLIAKDSGPTPAE